MKKLSRKVIMKNAWTIKRNFELKNPGMKALFSECLKEAWAVARVYGATERISIKSWFLNKNFNENERYLIAISSKEITRETEKAVMVKCTNEFGVKSFWIPKSCLA